MSEMSDPINIDAPSYYVLPDGTELREVIRRFRGDDGAAEHLVQAVIEYAFRAGRKPGVPMVDDLKKVIRCAQQAVNILEGRHVSDSGAPPTGPDPHTLATAIRQAIAILTPRANCVTGVGCDIQAAVNALTDAVGNEPTPAPAPPPEPERPSIALPVVFGGDQIPASGVYLALDSRGNQMVDGWAGGYRAPSTMIGPLPSERGWPKRFEREGEDA